MSIFKIGWGAVARLKASFVLRRHFSVNKSKFCVIFRFDLSAAAEIESFYGVLIVKFASEEQTADAVKCKNGIRRVESNIKVHLADSDTMRRFGRGFSRAGICSSEDGCRSGSSPTTPPRRNYPRPSSSKKKRTSTEICSGARSRQPIKCRDRYVDEDPSVEKSVPPLAANSSSVSDGIGIRCAARKNDIVILAVTQDLIPYAREVLGYLECLAAKRGEAQAFAFRSPRVVEFVLISEDHVEPCMHDFTEAGFLYAVVLTETNRKHRSCNLHILYTGEHQEHRNMPLFGALALLLNDFIKFISDEATDAKENGESNLALTELPPTPLVSISDAAQNSLTQVLTQNRLHPSRCISSVRRRYFHSSSCRKPRCSSPSSCSSTSLDISSDKGACSKPSFDHSSQRHHEKSTRRSKRLAVLHSSRRMDNVEMDIPLPDDPSFLVPSKRMSALLRMLADSRILSVGELDEILTFVTERKTRLTNGENLNAVLKARIMQTLYPGGVPISISPLSVPSGGLHVPSTQSAPIEKIVVITSAGTSSASVSPVVCTNQTASAVIPTRVTSRDSACILSLRENPLFGRR